MSQPIQPSENVYVSLTFGNIPRAIANEIVADAEEHAQGYDFSVDWGAPIGADDPTPVADEAADAVNPETPSTPLAQDPTGQIVPDGSL